ncbi:MAG: helix-turn-helix domain-containing protein [Candidatus Hodarchaeales archaeon]
MTEYSLLKNLFNLNEKEYNIFKYLLEKGRDNAKGIAHNTGIDVPRVYECLKKLEGMNFIVKEGDWSAFFEIDKSIAEKIVDAFEENEKKRQEQIKTLNRLIKEVTNRVNPKSEFSEPKTISLLKAPFTKIYSVEKDPKQFIEFYLSWRNSTEINLIQTPNQFLQAIQRFHTFSIKTKENIHTTTSTINHFRVIITGKFDILSLKGFVQGQKGGYIDFLGSMSKTVTIRESSFNQVKFLFGLSNNAIFFPICRPDDSLISIFSSNDWPLVETYRSYFWDLWRKATPKYRLQKNELIIL